MKVEEGIRCLAPFHNIQSITVTIGPTESSHHLK